MSLKDLAPTNTKRARESAARSFKKFVEDEGVTWDYLEANMQRENAALILATVVDKFGMHLAFKEGRKGQLLARHSVMRYYRQAKNWLLEKFPQHRAALEKTLLMKGQVLERYCMKRESGVFVNKAPACTKQALKKMLVYLYSTADTSADYQDAALFCLLWHLFGRASDLTLLHKTNLSIGSGDIFFVRFIRVKTSEEQGLSLCPDDDSATCPLLAIALALITQASPSVSLLNQLPEQQARAHTSLTPSAPLIDLIDHPEDVAGAEFMQNTYSETKATEAASGIHSYVNRVLERVAKKAGVTERLTSHSFRRGGAQHANGAGTCVQWIFDRGAWNMTAANKAFAYVFNTPSEDHKVARVLSSHDPETPVHLLSLDIFDSDTQLKIQSVASALFVASCGLETSQHNVNDRVRDTLMAYLLKHYPQLKAQASDSPVIQCIEACTRAKGFSCNDLLSWSSYPARDPRLSDVKQSAAVQETSTDFTKHPMYLHQASLIEQLIQVNQKLDVRLSVMEAKVYNKQEKKRTSIEISQDAQTNTPPVKRRRTSGAVRLNDAWFTWYAQEPRMWCSTDASSKHMRSTNKQIVAFMKLFLPDGFVLNEKLPQYRDEVMRQGTRAEEALLTYLRERGPKRAEDNAQTPQERPPQRSHKPL